MRELLAKLTSIPSACGHEYDVIRYLRDRLMDKADAWEIDGLGNLIVRKDGGQPGPVLMMSAHSDEVGSIVKKIENELEYPGQIKVNIIRESRAVDYAK